MEIKTYREISERIARNMGDMQTQFDLIDKLDTERWVRLDDLIKELNSICEHEAEDTYENDMESMGLLCDFVEKLEDNKGQ